MNLLLVVIAHEAAVDEQRGAGYVGCVVGGEEGDQAGDVFRRAEATEGDIPQECVEFGFVFEKRFVNGGGNGAGGDVVDGDAEGTEFDGEVAHHHSEAAFAAAVGGEAGEGHVLVDGADVDDAAGLLGVVETADEGLGEEEGSAEIDGHDFVVLVFGGVPEVGAFLHASVVDEDVGRTETVPCGVDEVAYVVHFGDVGLDDLTGAAAGFDGLAGIVSAGFAADVVDDDFGAFTAEAFGDDLADAGTASGDDGDFALQTHGWFSSVLNRYI